MKLIASLLSLSLFQLTLAQTCYYPNGTEAPARYKPCPSANTTYSICCSTDKDARCLRNGLCSWVGHFDFRGACTDEDWSGCQSICPMALNGTWLRVKECASNEFCCNLDQKKDCCKNGAKRFSLKAPAPSSSASETTTPSESPSPTTVGAIVGGVIGGIAALAILLGVGWWFLRRKKQTGQSDITHAYASTKSEADGFTPKGTPSPKPPLVEADAGPEQVLVEADAQPAQQRALHELPA